MKTLKSISAVLLLLAIFPEEISSSADLDWYKTTILYQIYPRSFKDSDNDGIGDLQGIIQKLDHFVNINVGAIWLSPIYPSPLADMGYDVSDYRSIAPEYGTLDDFKKLINEAHKRGVKVLLDFVPNHSSDEHEWFQKSVAKEAGYEDYYVWVDGKIDENGTRSPPNNWLSAWEGSAWEWNDQRQQYFLHQYGVRQPDLNYRSEQLQQEIKDIWTYWLDMGVDGFRIDAVTKVYEAAHLKDEPYLNDNNNYNSLDHVYTKDQDETFELVYEWRRFLDEYTATAGGDSRIMVTEASTSMRNVTRYYGNSTTPGAHISFNFLLLPVNGNSDANTLYNFIRTWCTNLDQELPNNWLTGSHDTSRVASRVGSKNVDGYNMLLLFLKGITVTYQGEEIGQENGEVSCEEGQDPRAIEDCSTYNQNSRDFERTPYQWDNSTNAGFNNGTKTWLPVSLKYLETNLANEASQENSHYQIYKKIAGLKAEFNSYDVMEYDVTGDGGVLNVKLSTSEKSEFYELIFNLKKDDYDTGLLGNFTIIVSSGGVQYTLGENLVLQSGDCVVVKRSS